MSLAFQIDAARCHRIGQLALDPTILPHERFRFCDLCSKQVFRTISHVDRYGFAGIYQMCEGCGLVFQNPHPTAEGYAEFYQRWYRPLISAYRGTVEDPKTIQSDQENYAQWLVRFLKQNTEMSRINSAIDLGGSTGIMAQAIQKTFGGRCVVLDPSPDELSVAEAAGLDCEQGLADDWDPRGRTFDLVVICRSIDHVLSISKVLNKVASVLKPGGYLFVDIVDFESAARTELDYRKRLKLDHVFYLSDETMRHYFARAGFEIVACDFARYQPTFLASYTGRSENTRSSSSYAHEIGRMLRERLVSPPLNHYPVDALTRVARRLRRSLRSS